MIIYVTDIFNVIEKDKKEYHDILKCLQNVLRTKMMAKGQVIMITIDENKGAKRSCSEEKICEACDWNDDIVLQALGFCPFKNPFEIFPVRSQAQERLFYEDKERRRSGQNLRKLQKEVRILGKDRQ